LLKKLLAVTGYCWRKSYATTYPGGRKTGVLK